MTRKGFSLIELLVVVLIMGILASVAMPQYFKSVEKARISEAVAFTRAMVDAQNEYWMKKGSYADSIFDLGNISYANAAGTEFGGLDVGMTYFDVGVFYASYMTLHPKQKFLSYGRYVITVEFTTGNRRSGFSYGESGLKVSKVYIETSMFQSMPEVSLIAEFGSFGLVCELSSTAVCSIPKPKKN